MPYIYKNREGLVVRTAGNVSKEALAEAKAREPKPEKKAPVKKAAAKKTAKKKGK